VAKYIADIPDTYVVKDGYVHVPFSFADSGDFMIETNIKAEPYSEEVKVGDEMENKTNSKIKVCVTHLYEDGAFTGFAMKTVPHCCTCGESYSLARIESWRKTGKHYPEIAKLFSDLEKQNEEG